MYPNCGLSPIFELENSAGLVYAFDVLREAFLKQNNCLNIELMDTFHVR